VNRGGLRLGRGGKGLRQRRGNTQGPSKDPTKLGILKDARQCPNILTKIPKKGQKFQPRDKTLKVRALVSILRQNVGLQTGI